MMLDPSARAIADLSSALDTLVIGVPAEPEIARWLRAAASAAARVVPPPIGPAPRGYTRSLIRKTGAFEIVLMHWPARAATSIHDHGGSLCWFALAQGSMEVENFRRYDAGTMPGWARIGPAGRTTLRPGDVDYRADDLHLHRCSTADVSTISLHVYARPLEHFHAFDERTGRCEDAVSAYDAVLELSA